MSNNGFVSPKQIDDMMNADDFGTTEELTTAGTPQYSPNGDRLDIYVQKINISNIDEYKYNPRIVDNESFIKLKDSIANVGILSMLNVSKNPTSLQFELFNGGNTRLRAIKQLYRETGDSKFLEINCNVYPWIEDDAEKIIQHLVENEVRGKLYHTDKAKTIANLEQIFKAELQKKSQADDEKDSAPGAESFEGEDTSLRAENYGVTGKFIEFLQSKNYKVAEQTLSTCRFTNNYLIGVIDYHLNQGLGSKKVAQIRLVYNNLKRYIKDKDIADFKANDLDALFKKSLSKYNNFKQLFDYYKLVDVVAGELLAEYPFNELYPDNKEGLVKVMISKKPKKEKVKKIEQEQKTVNDDIDETNDTTHSASKPSEVKIPGVESGATYNDEDEIHIQPEEKPQSGNSLADDFLAESGYDAKGNDSTDIIKLQSDTYSLAIKLINSLSLDVEIQQINYGAGFLVTKHPINQDLNTWCLFYILVDYSLAANPMIVGSENKEKIIHTLQDVKYANNEDQNDILKNLYNANSIHTLEDEIYNLIDKSQTASPFVNLIGGFKRTLKTNEWQMLSQLEFMSFQIVKKSKELGVPLWS